MPTWGGAETIRSPAQVLAARWINRFGQSKQRYRFVAIFRELLETYTWHELERVVDVLHDRHRAGQFDVQSPAIIEYVGAQILVGKFYEGKRLEIL